MSENINPSWEAFEPIASDQIVDWIHDERANNLMALAMFNDALENGVKDPKSLGVYTRSAAEIVFCADSLGQGINETMAYLGHTFDDPMFNAYKWAAELIQKYNLLGLD